jgi:hypothetical protein
VGFLVKRLAIGFLSAFFLFGCGEKETEEKPRAKNHPPVVKEIRIVPELPSCKSTLQAVVKAGDIDDDRVEYAYQWEVNGNPVPDGDGPRLSPGPFSRGNEVVVWVTPSDGKVDGESRSSAPIEIMNSPPVIEELVISPQPAFPGNALEARVVASDADEDEVSLQYVWVLNDEELEEDFEETFPTDNLKRGDRVSVRVIPDDMDLKGEPLTSEEVVLENRPPEIISTPPEKLAAPGHYRYAVRAKDPDGDSMQYSLEAPTPEGMAIDPATGVLEWKFKGVVEKAITIDIRVQDGNGGEAQQRYDFTVTIPEKS